MTNREEILLESLIKFYNTNPEYLNILANISNQKTSISLRELDYLVTNYSYNNKTKYMLSSANDEFIIYNSYKNQLKGYSKKCFDSFCRRQRIFVFFDNLNVEYLSPEQEKLYKQRTDGIVTTIGQLNFFKCAKGLP